MHRRPRQPRVAELELHAFDRQPQGLGRDLCHRGPRSRAHVARGARDLGRAVRQQPGHGGGRREIHRIRGARHAPADQPASVAHRARLRVAPAPAEALGRHAIAFARRAAGEGQLLELVLLRLIAQPQLDGIDIQRDGELVHRRFERKDAAHLAGGAHVRRRVHVHACEAMARMDVRT